jgi:hypothetical protein
MRKKMMSDTPMNIYFTWRLTKNIHMEW